jgi:hypothetical protein
MNENVLQGAIREQNSSRTVRDKMNGNNRAAIAANGCIQDPLQRNNLRQR